ncbi:hypothetical protein [Nocardioides sp. AE5]|uniref:hypothetical protein n=1 Tax=Nocardioides sp. AE5 TaxID=2962573 RepID=UPI002881FD49|nr:hypothetical protein [Nocardioides sp. AE5]MDT0201731.1 hypothetical protein [Nocardioides sp. AE5]
MEIVTEAESEEWAGVLRSAFGTPSPTRSRWQAMTSGLCTRTLRACWGTTVMTQPQP